MAEVREGLQADASPVSFRSAAEWRGWLRRHHASAPELVVRCWRAHARERGLTYPEALDEALCCGWIDGVRRRVDEDSFSTRFTPRRPNSIWSAVNIRRFHELEAQGRVQAAGRAAFARRTDARSRRYSFESKPVELETGLAARLRRNRRAWTFFQAQPPGYRRTSIFWVMEARREETRLRRLGILIDCSAEGRRIPLLARSDPKRAEG